jgi:hypothetical protein
MTSNELPRTRAWPTGEREVVRARIAAHRAADEIVQDTGWNGYRGCAIGCSLDRYDHAEYARVVLGDSPHGLLVAQLIDDIHEALPREVALDWPGRVADALAEGADTTLLLRRWLHWLLSVELADFTEAQPMAALMERSLGGDEPAREEWNRADWAARAAREAWAAMAAREAWAAWAAWDAWNAWDARYASAARNARAARDARDAWPASAQRMADALIEIMRSLPAGGAL